MSALFDVALIVAVIGALIFIGAHLFVPDDDLSRVASRAGLVVFIGIGGTLILIASVTSVPAQSVGVAVSFGKPYHEYDPGLHFKRPWARVVDMDGRTQTEIHDKDHRVEIRLGNQATGYVQSSLRWKIRPQAAGSLYADYREEDQIGPKLVDLELAAAMNTAFATFDPLANVKAEAGDKTAVKVTNDQLSQLVQDRLNTRIGDQAGVNDRIVIEQVVISKVDFDDATQSRINQLQQEIGNTRIAEQREQTAGAEARSNRILAASVSKDPNVIVSKCMDQQREAIEKGQPLPPGGFGCWPGSGGSLIVDGTHR
jgi:hypothetical protein